MILLILSSCDKIPDIEINPTETVSNSTSKQLDTAATSLEASAELPEITEQPAVLNGFHIEDSLTSGNAKVVFNADVSIPDYKEIPTVYLSPQNLTLEQFNNMANYLVEDNPIYYQSSDENSLSIWSKEELDDILSNLKIYYEDKDLDEKTKYNLEHKIDRLENQMYDSSPKKADEKLFDGTLTSIDNSETWSYVTNLKAYMNHDQAAWLSFCQSFIGNQSLINFSNRYYGMGYDTLLSYKGIDAKKMNLSYDECLQIAKDCVYAVDGENSNMTLYNSYIGYSTLSYRGYNMETSPQAYCFDFGRSYDGLVINPASSLSFSIIYNLKEKIYTERIRIIIDNDGIYEFSWSGYSENKSTQNENIQIMEYSEIHEVFEDYCSNNRIWTPNSDQLPRDLTATIDIYSVRLDLMLIDDGNGGYKTCPVWNYIGDINYDKEIIDQDGAIAQGEKNVIILTINSIDGSIMQHPQKRIISKN